jgi:O-antigen/teichoic acid export membrane protein
LKSNAPADSAERAEEDIATLAKGGRTNFFGFLLRLAARLPFLFIAGRVYGADALGRFAIATIIIEFAAQLATLGLKRGLAQKLSTSDRAPVFLVWDALLVGWAGSVVAAGVLMLFPSFMFPNSEMNGLDWLLPLTIFGWAASDIALAALAYQGNVGATVTARAIIEPWTISIAAAALAFYSKRDGLIIAYVLSTIAALTASIIPLIRAYGFPRRWRPELHQLTRLAWQNLPLAGADAIEWGSRRMDIYMLGRVFHFSPEIVGIYYVAQQVASLPQKLKTSFDPVLGPVITQNLADGNKSAVGKQVRQVGFWIIAAQVGIALALGIPSKAVMGLVGPGFVGGTGALAILLIAEAVAATAVVSEAALIYIAAKRNLLISIAMILAQYALSIVFVHGLRWAYPSTDPANDLLSAAGPALGLLVALAFASVAKALLLSNLLRVRVAGWKGTLIVAVIVASAVGYAILATPEWFQLSIGICAILGAYGAVIWRWGFTREDRVLFRMSAA